MAGTVTVMAELAAGLATDLASELPPPARALAGGTCLAQHVQQCATHAQAEDAAGQTGPHAGRGCSHPAWNGPQFGLTALLYLAGQSLPVGGFAWSQGLAAAVERGHAATAEGVRRWLWGVLRLGLARNDLPLLLRMHGAASSADAGALARWNALMLAGRESRELWQEEIQMGRALRRILHDQDMLPHWPLPDNAGYTACFAVAAVMLDQHARSMEPFSDPAAQQRAGVDAACAYVWSWLQNQVAVACKTVPLGQTAAQKLLLEFMPAVPHMVAQAAALPDEDIGSSLPGLALCSAGHERQYTRLFRS